MIRNALQRIAALPVWAKALLVLAALFTLGLSVVLSSLVVVLAGLIFIVAVFALIIRFLRHRPLRRWGIIAATSLVVLLVFTGISNALYFGGQPEQANQPEPQKRTAKPDTKEQPLEQAEKQKGLEQVQKENKDQGRYDAVAPVSEVVDGDTVKIEPTVEGEDKVRLIGMDTRRLKTATRVSSPTVRRLRPSRCPSCTVRRSS